MGFCCLNVLDVIVLAVGGIIYYVVLFGLGGWWVIIGTLFALLIIFHVEVWILPIVFMLLILGKLLLSTLVEGQEIMDNG